MKLKLEIDFSLREKKSHHKAITEGDRKKARLALKYNCVICGKKITEKYHRKLCSAKCAAIHNKNRKHKKVGQI